MEEEGVSKLVSVALDGDLRGTPKVLRKKTERAKRAAALLMPSAESLTGAASGAGDEVPAGANGGERPAARLDRRPLGAPETGTAVLEPEGEATALAADEDALEERV
jgi:hypothetical protein